LSRTLETLNPEILGRFLFNPHSLEFKDPFLDRRVHPEDLGIMMDKKLINALF